MLESPMQDDAEKLIERERQRFEDVKEFLAATGEASARTRSLIVILIVASVLTGVGVLNSLKNSWMSLRFELLRDCKSSYLKDYVGPCPMPADYASEDEYKRDLDLYQRRYLAFVSSASGVFVANRYFVHVPFFGMSFDVNDLGMLAGVGLVSILVLLRFSAGTELENLKLSFRETYRLKCFAEFYRMAAMRQVLTIPRLPERNPRPLERWLAKPVYFIPAGVYFWMSLYDLDTYRLGNLLSPTRMKILLVCELFFFLGITYLGFGCFRRSRELDSTWDSWWLVYNGEEPKLTGVRRAKPAAPAPASRAQKGPAADGPLNNRREPHA
jgi:hypothetical protein